MLLPLSSTLRGPRIQAESLDTNACAGVRWGRAPSHLPTLPPPPARCQGDVSIREGRALSLGRPEPLQGSTTHSRFALSPPSGFLLSLKQGHVRRGEGLSAARACLPPLILPHLFLGPRRLVCPLAPSRERGKGGEAIARKEIIVTV